jgi:hypothetical protein
MVTGRPQLFSFRFSVPSCPAPIHRSAVSGTTHNALHMRRATRPQLPPSRRGSKVPRCPCSSNRAVIAHCHSTPHDPKLCHRCMPVAAAASMTLHCSTDQRIHAATPEAESAEAAPQVPSNPSATVHAHTPPAAACWSALYTRKAAAALSAPLPWHS